MMQIAVCRAPQSSTYTVPRTAVGTGRHSFVNCKYGARVCPRAGDPFLSACHTITHCERFLTYYKSLPTCPYAYRRWIESHVHVFLIHRPYSDVQERPRRSRATCHACARRARSQQQGEASAATPARARPHATGTHRRGEAKPPLATRRARPRAPRRRAPRCQASRQGCVGDGSTSLQLKPARTRRIQQSESRDLQTVRSVWWKAVLIATGGNAVEWRRWMRGRCDEAGWQGSSPGSSAAAAHRIVSPGSIGPSIARGARLWCVETGARHEVGLVVPPTTRRVAARRTAAR